MAVDPTRTKMAANKEQPIHPLFGYLYITDKYEGLILTGAATTIDGNPVNNFLKKELCFNPDGLLYDAKHVTVAGHYAYVSCGAGLVVIDIDDPLKPKVTSIIGEKYLKQPHSVSVQFRYAYVCDEEGVKVLDVTDLAKPVPMSVIRIPEAHSIYLARTYAYVAAGPRGLVILDITNAEEPKVDQVYNKPRAHQRRPQMWKLEKHHLQQPVRVHRGRQERDAGGATDVAGDARIRGLRPATDSATGGDVPDARRGEDSEHRSRSGPRPCGGREREPDWRLRPGRCQAAERRGAEEDVSARR